MQKRERTPEVIEASDAKKARKVQEDPIVMATTYKLSQADPGEAVELPLELWNKIILDMTPGTFLILTSFNSLFSAIDKNDWIWQQFFKRDFPVDYEYVGRQLPFYVAKWRYFYLHTRHRYVLWYNRFFVKIFVAVVPFAIRYREIMNELSDNRVPQGDGVVSTTLKMPWFMRITMMYIANASNDYELHAFSQVDQLKKYIVCAAINVGNETYAVDYETGLLLTENPVDWSEDAAQTPEQIERTRESLFQDADLEFILRVDRSDTAVLRFKYFQRIFRFLCVTSLATDYNVTHVLTEFDHYYLNIHLAPDLPVLSIPGKRRADFEDYDLDDNVRPYFGDPRHEYDVTKKVLAKKGTIKYLAACVSCLASNPEHVCGKCQSVAYCGKDCADNHWIKGGHSKVCK